MLCRKGCFASFSRLLFSLTVSLFAQSDTATITGAITDASGAAVAGATIEATNHDTGLKYRVQSDTTGVYVVTTLPIGVYEVAVSSAGFQTVQQQNVILHAGDRARVDFQLQVGNVNEVINVTAQVPILERETSELGQVIENTTVTQMPLNGRNYQQLATLAPGVLPSRNQNFVTDAFSVNGADMFQNQFIMDGMDNNNYNSGVVIASNQVIKPSIDAIHEFKIETHNYSAEFGHGGGAVIEVTTKSGTNQLHGTAFEFLRNDKLDANDFFNSGRAKPAFRMNQFGGTLGGPIVKDRTFFFGSYQGTRIREKLTLLSAVPTPAMIQGDFETTPIYDPMTQNSSGLRQPFPNNRIPADRIDPVAVRVLALYPAPNRPGVQNFLYNSPRNDRDDQVDSRFDHRFRDSDTMFLRYSFHDRDRLEPGTLPPPANGGDVAVRLARAHAAVLSETHIFPGANKVNEIRLAYSRNNGLIDTPTRERLWEQFGFKGTFDRPDITGLPFFSPTGFANIGDRSFAPDPRKVDVRQIVENFSWNKGRHALKFGTNLRYFIRWAGITNFARGRFFFNGQFTSEQAGFVRGNSIADGLLGLTDSASLTNALNISLRSHTYEWFIQDDFKVNRRFTLNLGLRYEYQTPFWEHNNRVANFVFDPASPDYGSLAPVRGDSTEARSFQQPDLNNFAPRVGFAYQLTPKTVIRAGYGIFYDALNGFDFPALPTQNPPFFLGVDIPTSTASAASNLRVRDGFAPNALNPQSIQGRALASVWPYSFPEGLTNQWNLNLQRGLPGNSLFSVAYVGSNTVHRTLHTVDRNQPAPGAGALNPRRPFPEFAQINSDVPIGTANYQGLELKFERRFSNSFSTLNAFTWSHTLIGGITQNTRLLATEKSNSPQDLRQRFFSTVVYQLPLGQKKKWLSQGLLSQIVGGWALSTLFVAQGGLPLTPTLAANPANTTGGKRPDRLRDGNLPRGQRRPERWFDTTAFAVPAPFLFGNSAADVIIAPGLVNLDTSIARIFTVREGLHLDFRSEFFNLLNQAHFGFPNLLIDRPVGGKISSTASPARQIQFALKLIF